MNEEKETDKLRRERNRARKAALCRFTTGIRQLAIISPWKNLFVVGYVLLALLAWGYRDKLLFGLDSDFFLYPALTIAVDWSVALLLLLGLLCCISAIGTPHKAKQIQDCLVNAGFTNHKQQPPLLLAKYKHRLNPKLTIWEFDQNEIPLSVWEDKKENLKGALLDTILNAQQSRNGKRIILRTVSPRTTLPPVLHWQESYLSTDSFVLLLGESLTGRETVNLAKVPHILLGGSTGSGKSVLLRLLIMQAKNKGAEIYIADFKGGVDFPMVWHEKCHMCFDESELLDLLTAITDELECRKTAFRKAECANLDEYNAAANSNLNRIVFACDEVAEILDKTGLSKDKKDLVLRIEGHLSIIARQGRAFGIHLILATQRPSADLISGQIRSNLGTRICGRADNILSQIILDSNAAAEQIEQDAQGRFITNEGVLFQSYLFDEDKAFVSVQAQSGGVPYSKEQEAGNDNP